MAPANRPAAVPDQPPAAAIRALRDALALLASRFGYSAANHNTTLVKLGAAEADVQALHEYLTAHEDTQ